MAAAEFWDAEGDAAVLVWDKAANGPDAGPSGWVFVDGVWLEIEPVEIWDDGRLLSEAIWRSAFKEASRNLSKIGIQSGE